MNDEEGRGRPPGGLSGAKTALPVRINPNALVAPAPNKTLNRVLGDWKRFASTQHGIAWQKNFIDHRLRSDENVEEKATYIRMNPFRAVFIGGGEKWPHMIEHLV